MLKACSRCGRVHERSFVCTPPQKQKYKRDSQADRFRSTQVWKRKAAAIQKRDCHLCRVCLTQKRYNSARLSVHHIIPLCEDYDRRLDDDNLITLCGYHHELAERGAIARRVLLGLAAEPPTL